MRQTPDVIQLQERQPKERIIPPPKVSASSLFRFFKKADYLFESLENAALIPRFYEEGIDYLQVGQSKVAYPMVCFCDINMHLLASHVDFYGKYGLVFSKEWGCKNKIQPIHYINPDSPLRDDFSTAFCKALAQEEDSVSSNYLLSHMVYMKPLSGKMLRDGIEVDRTFSDEREWRYIPSETDRAGIPCVPNTPERQNLTYLMVRFFAHIAGERDRISGMISSLPSSIASESTSLLKPL